MYIKELYINAFGPILDAHLTFDRGLNVIEGRNESGKSSVAMFIKFIFYGLSARSGDSVSERQLYINWSREVASGYAVIVIPSKNGEKALRIERTVAARTDAEGRIKYSERLKVLDHETGMPIGIKGQPGEYFFGVPEQVFVSSAFAAQGSDVRPDSAAVKEAVENIILAADENVSVKRAVDAIEKARVKLMHKKGVGGEIYELEEKRNAIESKLISSRDSSARLIKAELSLADVKGNIESAKTRCATLEEISAVLEIFSRRSAKTRVEKGEEELERVKKRLESEDFGGAEDGFRSSLAVAIRDMERGEKLTKEYNEKAESLRENFPEGEMYDPAEDEQYAEKMLMRGRNVTVPALILLVLGILAFAASFLLRRGSELYLPVFCASAITIMVGVSLTILASAWKHEAKCVFEDWNVNNIGELREAVSEARAIYLSLDKERAAMEGAAAAAAEAENTLDLLSTCAKLEVKEGEGFRERAKRLVIYSADCTKRKNALDAELARLEGQISADRASAPDLSGEADELERIKDSEAYRIASAMSDEEKRGVARELQFTRMKLENLRGRELDLERECSSLRATAVSPSAAAEQLEQLNNVIDKKKQNHEAYVLAAAALRTASENIRLSVLPRLTREASAIMERVTDGKYGELGVSASFDMNFRHGEAGTLELDFLSAGTREAAYIALRLALVRALYDEEKRPPVILDESLCSLDEERVRRAVALLDESDVQVFLFSCRSLEGDLACGTKTVMRSRTE
ncbi:MAG: AAA family ATPase [Clostridia bacterium]|nr:AAA family ATPase [Clostridia bacterium]